MQHYNYATHGDPPWHAEEVTGIKRVVGGLQGTMGRMEQCRNEPPYSRIVPDLFQVQKSPLSGACG